MSIMYFLFAYPAAQVAAFFCGAELQWLNGKDVWILIMPQPIHVTPSCSGFGFFSLFAVYVLGYMIRYCQRSQLWVMTLVALPCVYVLTIMANAARMICAYHLARVTHELLPSFFQPIIHMAVGVAFFLSVFILSTFLLERSVSYAKSS